MPIYIRSTAHQRFPEGVLSQRVISFNPSQVPTGSVTASFNPDSLSSSFTFWFKPDSLTSSNVSSLNITRWSDSSGRAHDFTQATAFKQPLINTLSSTLPGISGSHFNGNNFSTQVSGTQMSNANNLDTFFQTGSFHVFMVVLPETISSSFGQNTPYTSDLLVGAVGSAVWGLTICISASVPAVQHWWFDGGGFGQATSQINQTGSISLIEAWKNDAQNITYVRGSNFSSGTLSKIAGAVSFGARVPAFGASADGNYMVFSGSMAEIVFISRSLSLTESNNMRQYLGTKYSTSF